MKNNFQESFIHEAQELLKDLEEALLVLEDDYSDLQKVGDVFRVMHSLKGSANMFGFNKVGEVTHDLENIYDQIRSQEKSLDKTILNISLKTLDHINVLINNGDEIDENQHLDLLNEIKTLVGSNDTTSEGGSSPKSASVKKLKSYYIEVIPDQDILSNGTNPLFLIEDLNNLGKSYVRAITDQIPEWENLNPSECYVFWQLVLITDEDESEIDDVFIFVEDECSVKKELISDNDISLITEVESYLSSEETFDLATLKELNSAPSKEKKAAVKQTQKQGLTDTFIRVSSSKIDDLMGLVSQLVTAQGSLNLFAENSEDQKLLDISEHVQKLSRQLRDITFSMSLIPLDSIMVRFKRMVRDLSDSLDKKIQFVVEGADTELDKNIIDNLADPLMHMLRNSLDHGIESPSERIKKGKSETGLVKFKAYHSGAYVNIEISDDGKGLDPEVIRKKSIEKGIITAEDKLSESEILDLIFAPGFSTATLVTDVSGRGVGMDVVKTNIHELRGDVSIESVLGEGTKFKIRLPLTMSIIDGLQIRVLNQDYVLPLFSIEKCYETRYHQLQESQSNILMLDEEPVPYIFLKEEFGTVDNTDNIMQTIVVEVEGKKVGIIVDEIVGELQAVIKPLGAYYKQQDIFSGSTILGDGTVALILDPDRIYKNYMNKELH